MRLALTLALLGAAAPAAAEETFFTTPSENIQCHVGDADGALTLTCAVIERSGPLPLPRPAGCTFDWGHVFRLQATGEAVPLCAEAAPPAADHDLMEFGITAEFEGVSCHSAATGLDCRNLDGHGFFLSRTSQVLY